MRVLKALFKRILSYFSGLIQVSPNNFRISQHFKLYTLEGFESFQNSSSSQLVNEVRKIQSLAFNSPKFKEKHPVRLSLVLAHFRKPKNKFELHELFCFSPAQKQNHNRKAIERIAKTMSGAMDSLCDMTLLVEDKKIKAHQEVRFPDHSTGRLNTFWYVRHQSQADAFQDCTESRPQ